MKDGIQTISEEYVEQLIDFQPTEAIRRAGIGKLQRSGSVALFNMLVRNGVAYLADEVGMGKTYIGLAVMHLLRYQKPDTRVLIITPRRNIQEKWASDLSSFVQQNWRCADHRVKTPQGSSDWPVRLPDRMADWVRDLHEEDAHDTVLRMSSFSLGVNNDNAEHEIGRFKGFLPERLRPCMDSVLADPCQPTFIQAIRELVADYPYDLIIVDEAHNLKHGFVPGEPSSIRNETIYHLFHPNEDVHASTQPPWLLLLSATPMENGEPASLVQQFQVFGREQDTLLPAEGQPGESAALKAMQNTLSHEKLRDLQKRLIVRRVGELRLNDGSRHTRNMYRREWRQGGVDDPDSPMSSASPAERLINAVIQKNVFELLQRQSGGRFRIGALESFEIYSGAASSMTETDDTAGASDQNVADRRIIADLCESYRRTFKREVPHPKLNAVSAMLARHIAAREKALVFVRRVATTRDLASRVSEAFDEQILNGLRSVVDESEQLWIDKIDAVWRTKRADREYQDSIEPVDDESAPTQPHDVSDEEQDAKVSDIVPSLFTWYFRGEHRGLTEFPTLFSGRRLREQLEVKNRFALILEENYVDWVLKRPESVLSRLAQDARLSETAVCEGIASTMPAGLYGDDNQRRNFHSVQYATLAWMYTQPCYHDMRDKLHILIDELFGQPIAPKLRNTDIDLSAIKDMISVKGLYPTLARSQRGTGIWQIVARGVFEEVNENADFDFRQALRRREQIRQLQMALFRHGAPMVDLYFSCIAAREGRLSVKERSFAQSPDDVAEHLFMRWQTLADYPERWRASAAWELAEINTNFDLIRKLNFPNLDVVDDTVRPLDAVFLTGAEPAADSALGVRSVRRLLNQELAGQAPTAVGRGGQDDQRRHRITNQFRMPGMPWVVVATNVYEEGVDLHTYCKTVVHHGISHTASSVEQRTGRVDRIGGLIQRHAARIAGIEDFSDDDKIQSLFPYQNDTFEKFQVRRVLSNCNRFLESLHDIGSALTEDKEMYLGEKQEIPPQITNLLMSPFDVHGSPWIAGQLTAPDRQSDFNKSKYLQEVRLLEERLADHYVEFDNPGGQGLERHYRICSHEIKLTPRSHREGDHLVMSVQIDDEISAIFDCAPQGDGWCENVFVYLSEALN